MDIHDTFEFDYDARWQLSEIGNGQVLRRPRSLHLTLQQSDESAYHDAQITDYDPVQRNFQYQPPLRLTVRAYTSTHPNDLRGTLGFGFWNHPFVPNQRGFRLPQALWFFFGAPPNDMRLALDVPGNGWKAATINAAQNGFRLLLPTAPLAIPLMNVPVLYRRLWPIGQRALGVTETGLDQEMLTREHTYVLEWLPNEARFFVDGQLRQRATTAIPDNPLGFIAWIDNQYAIVTPQGQFKFGGLSGVKQMQALVLQEVKIETHISI